MKLHLVKTNRLDELKHRKDHLNSVLKGCQFSIDGEAIAFEFENDILHVSEVEHIRHMCDRYIAHAAEYVKITRELGEEI